MSHYYSVLVITVVVINGLHCIPIPTAVFHLLQTLKQWTSLRFCKLRQVQSVVNDATYLFRVHGLHGPLTFGSIRCDAGVAGCVCMHEQENESKLGCV